MLFEQLAEMICIIISHTESDVLDAGILLLFQKLPGLFHAHADQMIDRRVTRFAFENF